MRGTIVNIYSTVRAGKTFGAITNVPVNTVDALGSIVTGERVAVILIDLAVLPLEPLPAEASDAVAGIDARPAVSTRVRIACTPGGYMAVGTMISKGTGAMIRILKFNTGTPVRTHHPITLTAP